MRHRQKPDIVTAFRLRDGLFRLGTKVLSYRRAKERALRRGARWLRVLEDTTLTYVDLVDLC